MAVACHPFRRRHAALLLGDDCRSRAHGRHGPSDHPRRYGRIAVGIDQNETAGGPILGVNIEINRTSGFDPQHADRIHLKTIGRLPLKRCDV